MVGHDGERQRRVTAHAKRREWNRQTQIIKSNVSHVDVKTTVSNSGLYTVLKYKKIKGAKCVSPSESHQSM